MQWCAPLATRRTMIVSRCTVLAALMVAALMAAASAATVTAAACSSVSALDRHSGAGRSVATADSAPWAAVAAADGLAGVRLFPMDTATVTAGALLATPSVSLPPRAAACDRPLLSAPAAYSPFYGKSVAMWGNLLAVGAPDRGASAFSSIDVVSLSALTAAVSAGTSAAAALIDPAITLTLTSNTSSDLGVLLSLDAATGTSLASSHDGARIAVFSPLVGRASSSFDGVLANDTWVTLPVATATTSFTLDSFSLARGVMAVTGVELDAATATCKPVLYTFTYIAATASEPNQWKVAARAVLLRSTAAAATAPVNSVPCQAAPAGSLPVELSADASRLVVGSPRQGCAYAVTVAFGSNNLQTLTVSGRCVDSLLYGSEFGRSVGLTTAAADTFVVASSSTVTHFAFAEWTNAAGPNPLDPATASAFFQFPNRLQSSSAASSTTVVARRVALVASRSTMTIIAQQPLSDGTAAASSDLVALLSNSAVPAGQQWNPATHALENCVAGRFSTGLLAGVSSYAGCQLCPAGTFQSSEGSSSCTTCGADTYCPTGSVAAYPAGEFSAASAAFSSDLPYGGDTNGGGAASSAFAFEEVLVGTVFSVSAWPAMIILFVLIGIIAVVFLGSFWADADGDQQDCCSSVGNCCLHSYRLLGRFKYFTAGRPGPFPYTRRDPTTAPDVVQYAANGGVERWGTLVQKSDGSVTHSVHNDDGSVTTVTTEALDPHAECAAHAHRSPECEGFVTLVFVLFGLSVVCFTGVYLASYDPSSAEGTSFQNVFRTRTEQSWSSDTEPEYAQGLEALQHAAFTIQVGFVGLSAPAAQACTLALVQSLTWEGCTVPGSGSSGPQPCSTLYGGASSSSLAWSDSTARTCVLSLNLPRGVALAASSALRIAIPAAASFQALRLHMSHNATAVALALPAQGTQGSNAHEDNTAAIGAASFTETLSFADANTREQRLLAPLERRWLLTPVAYRTQRTGQWADRYDTVWYTEARDEDAGAGAVLPSQTPTAFEFASAASASPSQTVQLSLRVSDRWTLQQTQRLMGGQAVLWVLILAVVAVFHLLMFAEALFAIAVNSCCRGQRAKQLRVAQRVEPGQPAQLAPMHHLYPQSPLPMSAIAPLPPLQPPAGSWSHYDPVPYPYGGGRPYDPRAAAPPLTPGRPYGSGLPATPHALSFQSHPGSSLAEDRARFQAARARLADERIELELARGRPMGGGFQV